MRSGALLLLVVIWGVDAEEQPLVKTAYGLVRGTYQTSPQGNRYASFEGIPYARPPIGKLRFEVSEPPEPWLGVKDTVKYGNYCLQYTDITDSSQERIQGSEDCLFLNVFTPKLLRNRYGPKLCDVIVFFHGGAFMFGESQMYGPVYIMDRPIVLVTVNYRLGPLGFLSTGDAVVPGNNGLKDQVLALKWVRMNIAAFGGNPDSVTIAGSSAGGASVDYHMLSPMSKGLFHRGMSFSGTSLCPWSQTENLPSKARTLASALNCSTVSSEELVKCLKQVPGRDLVQQVALFMKWLYNPFSPFGPTVEVAGPHAFLTEQPIDAYRKNNKNLPWLTSVTTSEGLYPVAAFVANETLLAQLQNNFPELAPFLLDYNNTVDPSNMNYVSELIRQFYFQDRPIDFESVSDVIMMAGNRLFHVSASQSARLRASISTAPVYFYQYAYRASGSLSDKYTHTNNNYGASHADDTAMVLNSGYIRDTQTRPMDREMVQLSLDIWTSFASTGDPNPKTRNINWNPVKGGTETLDYLYIEDPVRLSMQTSENMGNASFWRLLPINEPMTITKLSH